jgi:hypothetical protein
MALRERFRNIRVECRFIQIRLNHRMVQLRAYPEKCALKILIVQICIFRFDQLSSLRKIYKICSKPSPIRCSDVGVDIHRFS